MEQMKVGIIGAGRIAANMAKTLDGMDDAAAYAIAARNLDRAQKFAKEWGFEKAYGSYEELVNDPEVELIYIATPHPFHIEHAKLCINHGKPVLCEKPFTVNAVGAKEVFALAKEKEVFITEAIWTRYLPSRKIIDDIIASGEIGEIKGISANLGYDMHTKERLIDPKLAGGALLDVGIYPLNFASMVLGDDVEETLSSCVKLDSGVDAQNSIILKYKNGSMASIQSSALTGTEQYGMIYGTKGYLIAENINDITAVKVYTPDREFVREITMPEQITGFEYEVRASMKAIREGKLECMEMPHEESIRIMEQMDGLRKDWGIEYPFEKGNRPC